MARDILFIGHANPEDNDFTLWLKAKLCNEGYKAECDLSYLTGGEEDYWKVLQDVLEQNSVKYLLVLSKDTFLKQGVIDEWEQVKGIAKKHKLIDFIYVLKIDDVPFDVRIGLAPKNHFRFDVSWASGLKSLLYKLHKDSVTKTGDIPLSANAWIKNKYSTNSGIIEKKETYYSNWLPVDELPSKLYFFTFVNSDQAEFVRKNIKHFPVIRHDNYILTFSDAIPTKFDNYDYEIEFSKREHIETNKAFEKYETDNFPCYDDLRRFLVRLLKEAWNLNLQNRGLKSFEFSQKTIGFFYLKNQLEKDKVFFKYNGKSTYKQLLGDFFQDTWHYGLSTTVLLNPIVTFSLKAHLIFSNDGFAVWSDTKKLHKARRSKGKSLFNKEWRGLMLAFLASLSDDGNYIRVPLCEKLELILPISTLNFHCDYGYEEPKTEGRIVPLDFQDESMEEEDGELNEFEEISINESDEQNTAI